MGTDVYFFYETHQTPVTNRLGEVVPTCGSSPMIGFSSALMTRKASDTVTVTGHKLVDIQMGIHQILHTKQMTKL